MAIDIRDFKRESGYPTRFTYAGGRFEIRVPDGHGPYNRATYWVVDHCRTNSSGKPGRVLSTGGTNLTNLAEVAALLERYLSDPTNAA